MNNKFIFLVIINKVLVRVFFFVNPRSIREPISYNFLESILIEMSVLRSRSSSDGFDQGEIIDTVSLLGFSQS